MSISLFDAPIPGQSLTVEPKNSPWENPPMMTDPLDVFKVYMEQLAEEETLDDVMDMIDIGVPISVISDTMLGMGVMEGIHSIDTKVLLRPFVMKQIQTLAEAMDIDYKVTMEDYRDKDAEAKKKRTAKLAAKLAVKTGSISGTLDQGEQIMQQTQQDLEEPQQEEMPMEATKAPQGLMAKEQM